MARSFLAPSISRSSDRVVVIRPYEARVRTRVFACLEAAGLPMDRAEIIPSGSADGEVIASLKRMRFDVLLLPFHAHRTPEGDLVNGLNVAAKLIEHDIPRAPIIMPVSQMGGAAFDLMFARADSSLRELMDDWVFMIEERTLDDRDLYRRVASFVEERRASGAGPVSRILARRDE